ncbi:SulP family inorganic anion transporter [Caldimonas brevitalea]|uniref:Sulfate permease, SulP family n=1 Tax=Caldimonas brevitalea TaxID=413882 RepID=A0A0G3BEI4_9BURK|nr:solute carrier family 23 protein [Caldimonas brevitalea]AKJ27804.1 sulfate permease, SulP family [Caldimonas brevitalea]
MLPHPTLAMAAGLRRLPQWKGELRGGLTAGVLTLITSVSYAAVAGAPLGPDMAAAAVLSGLLAATVGGAVAGVLGSVPVQVFSPRASVAVVIATAATTLNTQVGALPNPSLSTTVAALTACLLLAALLQVAFSVLRLGALIRLIPHAVTAGLTIAIAVKLAWSQGPHLFALGAGDGLARHAPLATGLAGIAAIAVAYATGRGRNAIILGVCAGLAATGLLQAAGLDTGRHLPSVDWQVGSLLSPATLAAQLGAGTTAALQHMLPNLVAFAFLIALMNSMETLTSALALEQLGTQRFDPNRALLAGGLGSLASVCIGGLPVAGSASAAAVQAGGRTRACPLIGAAVVALLSLGFSRWIDSVPLAVVAAVLLGVAFDMALAPARELSQQWRQRGADGKRNPGELPVAVLVGVLLLWADMLTALTGGVLLATALAFFHMRDSLVRRQYDANAAEMPTQLRSLIGPAAGRHIQVIELGQPLFFATVETAVRVIERMARSTRFAIIDLSRVAVLDATAARTLSRACCALNQSGQQLLVVRTAYSAGFDAALRPCPVFDTVDQALHYCASRSVPEIAVVPSHGQDDDDRCSDQGPDTVVCEDWTGWVGGVPEPAPITPRPVAAPLPPPPAAAPARPASAGLVVEPRVLQALEQCLLHLVGPLGSVMLRRAMRGARTPGALCRAIAVEIADPVLRERFVTEAELLFNGVPATPPAAPQLPQRAVLNVELVDEAERELTAQLGPIAKVLVRRSQRHARNQRHFYQLLSRQLDNPALQRRFLARAGFAVGDSGVPLP